MYQVYNPTNWKDNPNEETPVNATNLNHLEQGLKNLETYVLTNGGSGSNSEPIGTIKAYAGTTIPDGYLICDGSQLPKTDYGELFAVLGTAFNLSSDTDSTKFRIPDLRGRVIVGVGSFDTTHSFTLAKTGGEYEHVLTVSEIPNMRNYDAVWTERSLALGGTGWGYTADKNTEQHQAIKKGGGQSHNNLQPYLALNYIIKATKTTTLIAEVEDSLESDSTTNAPSIHAINQKFGEVVLYDSVSGSTGDVELNSSTKQFKYLEIYFSQGGVCGYTKFYNPYNKIVALTLENYYNDSTIHNCRKNYHIEENKLAVMRGATSTDSIGGANGTYTASTEIIYINRVVGIDRKEQ